MDSKNEEFCIDTFYLEKEVRIFVGTKPKVLYLLILTLGSINPDS